VVALNAVLRKFQDERCDGVICCGDIIGIGAYPEETVSAIMQIPNLMACVCGNHERYFTDGMPSEVPNDEQMSAEEMAHHKWEHALLSERSRDFLSSLKLEKSLAVGGKRLYVAHYAMDENKRYKWVHSPSLDDLDRLFGHVDADIILFGHNHGGIVQQGDRYYINCGSLGCPAKEKNIARAGILTLTKRIFYGADSQAIMIINKKRAKNFYILRPFFIY